MGRRFLMALDAGGGSGRCLLLDVDSGAVVIAKRDWAHPAAPDTAGLGYDMDLPRVWSKLCEASREALAMSGASPGEVLGIAATSMRNTTVVIDDRGRLLFSAPNQDARALAEALGLGAERGRDVQSTGGHWPSPLFTGSRLLWMKNNSPQSLERASMVLSLSDWLSLRMCGEARAERSQAGETLLYDLELDDWSPHLIEGLGFEESIFPAVVDAGARIGELLPQPASDLGLVAGTPVAAGGADTQCALLGSGACEPGDLAVVAGTTLPIQLACSKLVLDPEGHLWSGRHAVPGLFVLESNGLTAGYVLEWFAGLLFADYDDPVRVLLGKAARSEPGGYGVYSTLGACLFDACTIGIPLGSLTMSHMVSADASAGRNHVSRAVLEGIAYSARANIEQIMEVAGAGADRVFLTGGMSRSELWDQILADVLGRELKVPATPEASALGAAVCAGVGAGVYPDLSQGSKAVASSVRTYSPGADTSKYQSLYDGWLETLRLRKLSDSHVSGLMTMSMLERAPQPGTAPGPAFRPTILVTSSMDDTALAELRELGEVEYAPWREKQVVYDGGQELVEALRGYRIFVTEMDIVDFESIRELPELKAIVSCRVNPVNIDLETATAHAIPVMNTPGRNADAVADFTLACMLMLARGLQEACGFLKLPGGAAGDMARMGEAYFKYQGSELWRKTVGIVGLGEVGSRVAARARSCGARVVYYDPGVPAIDGAGSNVTRVSFEELISRSDFVTLHAPASEATAGMMGREQFSAMRRGSYFINTARASLIDGDALRDALESGHLAGAALDVFPVEPPASDDPVVARPNVIATPHLGGNTFEVAAHQGSIAAQQLRDLLRGERPGYLLNPEVLDLFDWTAPRPEPPREELERLARRPRPSMTS